MTGPGLRFVAFRSWDFRRRAATRTSQETSA
jgi:hypothetical protein